MRASLVVRHFLAFAALGTGLIATLLPAPAEDLLYAGKTIQLLVGFSTGGGYDLYGRTLARYLGRHIPGVPQVLVQNMPGAGSLKLVNYLYNVAPKDGTTIAEFAPGVVIEPLTGRSDGVSFKATELGWVGSISQEVSVCAFMATAGIRTIDDMREKPSIIGASGIGAESDVFPTVLRNLFHLPLRIVPGYPGGAEITTAMQRHEVDGRCGWSWTSLLSRNKAMLTAKEIELTLQIALTKSDDPDLATVPSIMDLAGDPATRAALELIVSRQSIARPFAAPPGIPPGRLSILRDAFDATMTDPEFLAAAQAAALDIRPLDGKAVEALIKQIYGSPAQAVKIATEAMRDAP